MAWRLTKSMERFRSLVNTRWPQRDKASDGTIGDTAHQASTSAHNPDDTPGSKAEWDGDSDSIAEVRGFDMDADLRETGTTAQMLVDHLIRLPNLSSIFRYIIFNRKIYRAANGWKAETYAGSNPHTEHVHFSGAYSQAADDNVTFNFRLNEVGTMALTEDDKTWIKNTVGPGAIWGAQFGPDDARESAGQRLALAANAASASQVATLGESLLSAISAAGQDPQTLATAIATLLTPAVIASLAETVPGLATLDVAEVQAACEAGIRAVLGGLNE